VLSDCTLISLSTEASVASRVNSDSVEQDISSVTLDDDAGVVVWTDGSVGKDTEGIEYGGYAAAIFPSREAANWPTPNI
jgi:hypothetical protein